MLPMFYLVNCFGASAMISSKTCSNRSIALSTLAANLTDRPRMFRAWRHEDGGQTRELNDISKTINSFFLIAFVTGN